MPDQGNNGEYSTKNTALAAYLRLEGFNLLDVSTSKDDAPAVFYFETDPHLKECERKWDLGKAEGNLCDYWTSYRRCLRMIVQNPLTDMADYYIIRGDKHERFENNHT
jgi:hypothetical protein